VEDLIETLTRGNPVEVKVVLASVALALAVYPLGLIAVTYGKVRPPFVAGRAAGLAHRASGDAIAVLLVVVATMCLALFGFEDDAAAHVAAACGLLAALATKIAVLRLFPAAGRLLPLLGSAVFVLLALTWITSAGACLADS
jgi:hypothetical protein